MRDIFGMGIFTRFILRKLFLYYILNFELKPDLNLDQLFDQDLDLACVLLSKQQSRPCLLIHVRFKQ